VSTDQGYGRCVFEHIRPSLAVSGDESPVDEFVRGLEHAVGAARVHLSDDEWKPRISEQIDNAKAVTITMGRTPGLGWELAHIVQAGHLGKTIFVAPPVDSDEIKRRWDFIANAVADAGAGEHPLPADPSCVVAVQMQPADRITRAYCADRRDEATYRAAITTALT
jgi:hypothetical protein